MLSYLESVDRIFTIHGSLCSLLPCLSKPRLCSAPYCSLVRECLITLYKPPFLEYVLCTPRVQLACPRGHQHSTRLQHWIQVGPIGLHHVRQQGQWDPYLIPIILQLGVEYHVYYQHGTRGVQNIISSHCHLLHFMYFMLSFS